MLPRRARPTAFTALRILIFGIPPTNRDIEINVIDIIRIKNGRYAEHWGQHNFAEVIRELGQEK